MVTKVSKGNGLRRNLLKDRAYAELKDRILKGDFEPGTFLSERQIVGWLRMSKTPIRAALEKLEMEGLVRVSPQQGILVREMSIHDIADQFEIRAALETYVVRNLAGRLTPDQVAQLEANLAAQDRAIRENETSTMVTLDAEFHILFSRFLDNQEILRVMEQLREKIHRVILRVNAQHPERLPVGVAEHKGIAEAVIRGDAALAAQRVQEHLEFGKQYLLSPRGR
jgi:DNA-binding GntR family transcriptional regulator